MKDFNFFDQLSGGKKKKTTTLTYVLSAVLLLVLALGGLSLYNVLKLKDLRDENIALQEKVNDPTHQQDYWESLIKLLILSCLRSIIPSLLFL